MENILKKNKRGDGGLKSNHFQLWATYIVTVMKLKRSAPKSNQDIPESIFSLSSLSKGVTKLKIGVTKPFHMILCKLRKKWPVRHLVLAGGINILGSVH